jgi:hypothetical protein
MGGRQQSNLRWRVAQEAARIINEEGVTDFRLAKQKAVDRCGLRELRHLPGNDEIEAALRQHQRLFGGSRHQANLRRLRTAACKAMRFLETFQPRLVGPVLSGLATEHSGVQLHLFADHPESVELYLHNRGIRSELKERRYRIRGDDYRHHPVYEFSLGGADVEAAVFSLDELRQPPFSPIDGQPMQRATLNEAEALAEKEEPPLFC